MLGPPVDVPYRFGLPHPKAVVEVLVHPLSGGGDFQDEAVIDSGSDYTWVPHGVAAQYGWTIGEVDPVQIDTIGADTREADRILARVKIWNHEFVVSVCELWPESKITYPLIGRDILREFVTTLDGPQRKLSLEQP